MSTGKTNRFLKLLLGGLLLPAVVAITSSAFLVARRLSYGIAADSRVLGLAFWGGYAVWLAVFAFLPKPMRTYVLAHELTHALSAMLMGARVGGLKVSQTGGQVSTSKTNWLITLAPYFFPFYAVLFIICFFIANQVWGLERWVWILFFLVGLGWSFHVTFTLFTLLSSRQPDVQSQGWLFSMVTIFFMNLFTMLLTTALLSQVVSFEHVLTTLGRELVATYGWTLDKALVLWHRLASYAFDR